MSNSVTLTSTSTLGGNVERCLAKDLVLTLNVQIYAERALYLSIKLTNTGDKNYFIRSCDFPNEITGINIYVSAPPPLTMGCMDRGECSLRGEGFTRRRTLSSSDEEPEYYVDSLKIPAYSTIERSNLPLTSACGFYGTPAGVYKVTSLYWLTLYNDPLLEAKKAGVVVTATTSFELE